jgi:hypothetical protein
VLRVRGEDGKGIAVKPSPQQRVRVRTEIDVVAQLVNDCMDHEAECRKLGNRTMERIFARYRVRFVRIYDRLGRKK